MRNRQKAFTVSIFGRSRMLNIVVADGIKAFPKSTWYDYSNQMKKAVQLEASIVDKGYMRPEDVPYVRRAVQNQRRPRKTDIALKFSIVGNIERVELIAGRKKHVMSISGVDKLLVEDFLKFAQQILVKIGRMV